MDKQERQTTPPTVNTARRRLAKGGLAAPVVLATLASKNALAAAPYNCTISGQLSGNTSSHGDPVDCSKLGRSPGFWKEDQKAGEWPSPYVYGVPEEGTCPVPTTTGTRFNAATALGSTFLDMYHCVPIMESKDVETKTCIKLRNGICKEYKTVTTTTMVQVGSEVVTSGDSRFPTGVPATLAQVLQAGGGLNETSIFALGRAAVASLLNAAKFAPDYPLTVKQVIDMFNAVCQGGSYQVNDTVAWNADQVKNYFESLYGGL
jgi:hypothetical protein